VVPFAATRTRAIERPERQSELLAALDGERPPGEGAAAIRLDGRFATVTVRSVPRQHRPYRPLAEVVADQHVFMLHAVEGTIAGFRFPDHSDGVEVDGYHLHFVDADRARGGHVLDFVCERGQLSVDPATDLHVELPPGVDLEGHHLDATAVESLRRIEG